MIITRKIQVIISRDADRESAREYMKQLYTWRDLIRKAANMIVTHKFVQQNIRDFAYVTPEIIDRFVEENPERVDGKGNPKFYVKDILNNEPGNSEQNTTYRVASSLLKGKCPSEFFACLNQAVANSYKERFADFLKGKASIPSYRNIPIPFPGKVLNEIRTVKQEYKDSEGNSRTREVMTLDFHHIPLELFFGRDRSGNRTIVRRALEGTYKFCGSSLMIVNKKKENDSENENTENKNKKKGKTELYLLMSVDVPQKETKIDENKTLYAVMGFETPILCTTNGRTIEDSILNGEAEKNMWQIGNREEYLYRRLQIQNALHNLQKACKYNQGGRGRKKKMQAIDRFHEKEANYIDTKMHQYSKMLIEIAIDHECGVIDLANLDKIKKTLKKTENEKKKFLLRNWNYHGLANKIEYKAKMHGIRVIVPKEKESEEE